jgi:hypothetical protein
MLHISVCTTPWLRAGPNGQAVRVIALPSFASSGVVALLNLRTLDVVPLHFKAS